MRFCRTHTLDSLDFFLAQGLEAFGETGLDGIGVLEVAVADDSGGRVSKVVDEAAIILMLW
jgi:hypothetical protein